MILDKIPRIECILIIPELITGELDNLIAEFDENSKSLKILKKYKKRIKTFNYIKNILTFSSRSDDFSSDYKIVSKLFNDLENYEKTLGVELFNSFINSLDPNDKIILTKFVINHIDRLINKYIKILVHIDDQVFVLSKQNKDNKKIFLKFFLPKIKKEMRNNNKEKKEQESEQGQEKEKEKEQESEQEPEKEQEPEQPNNIHTNANVGTNANVCTNANVSTNANCYFDGTINSLRDNIHITMLPTIEGHGLDGLFHLTFRIEGKKNVIFEYSKFASLNVDSNKLGVGIYPDEKCVNGLIFKIIQNLSKLVEIIKLSDYSKFDNNILNLTIYSNMLEYLTLDILSQLNLNNKLNYIYEKYFYSLGKETIKTIIDKLFRIIIFTFVELYFGLE